MTKGRSDLIISNQHCVRRQHELMLSLQHCQLTTLCILISLRVCVFEAVNAHVLRELCVFYELNKKGRISLNRIAVPPSTNCTPETLQNTEREPQTRRDQENFYIFLSVDVRRCVVHSLYLSFLTGGA